MKFIDKLSDLLTPLATFVNNQRYLLAIRDAFFVFFAPTMAASFLVLLNAMVFNNAWINENLVDLTPLGEISTKVYNGSFAMMAVFMALFIAYNLAAPLQNDKDEPLGSHAAVIALVSFVVTLPTLTEVTVSETSAGGEVINEATGLIGGVFSQSLFGSGGMFLAIIISLLSYTLYRKLVKNEKLSIKMPDGVPPAVSASFNSLIPGVLTILTFAIAAFLVETIIGLNIPEIITTIIQAPLENIAQTVPGMIVIVFLLNFLWVFGIHGASILSPITGPIFQIAIDENTAAALAGEPIPNIVTQTFIDSNTLIMPMALIISVFIFSKRKDMRAIGKLSLAPAVFNISEPVMFGMPVVFNPLLMIPYVLIAVFNVIVMYFLTFINLIGEVYIQVPWTTPPVLYTYLATGGDIPAAIASVLIIIADIIIFAPFIIALNREGVR